MFMTAFHIFGTLVCLVFIFLVAAVSVLFLVALFAVIRDYRAGRPGKLKPCHIRMNLEYDEPTE